MVYFFKLFIILLVFPQKNKRDGYQKYIIKKNYTMSFLGSSPLGLSFGLLGGGKDERIKPHGTFSKENISSGSQSFFSFGARVHRMYGDYKTIFTTIEKDPRTFYAYYGEMGATQAPGGNFLINSSSDNLRKNRYIEQNSSITNIIKVLQGNKETDKGNQDIKGPNLKYSDFAYLRDLGVYPSNRLMIARRFTGPIPDDLFRAKQEPLSVLVSWHKDATKWPFDLSSFGESWTSNRDGDIAKVLDEFGKEYPPLSKPDDSSGTQQKEGGLGTWLSKGGGIIPQYGFTDYAQYALFKELGIADDVNLDLLFQGNPNVITESSKRSLAKGDGIDTGLKGKFSVTMETDYEIKYIQGVDPTLTYYDILSNLLAFSTSESIFRFNLNFAAGAQDLLDAIMSGDGTQMLDKAIKLVEKTVESIGKLGETIFTEIRNFATKLLQDPLAALGSVVESGVNIFVSQILKKFKIELLSKIQALTGAPSGPYHITIGHPLRPLFCSGDMIPSTSGSGTSITFGQELGYNNLPKTINFKMSFTSARNLGSQEIYKKLSPRQVRIPSLVEEVSIEDITDQVIKATDIQRRRIPST